MIFLQRKLRTEQTKAEQLLWTHLRDRRFLNIKFRRQHALGKFIVDFFCLERGIVIEVDGGQHSLTQEQDVERTQAIENMGYHVLRYWNHEVLTDIHAVLDHVRLFLQSPHPALSHQGRGEK